MKKECESVRKSLRKHLHGHLFKPEQIRIERHLKKCAFCSSEFQALKHSAETRKLLKDFTPPEGMVQRVKAGVSGLSKLRRLLYRPLWLAGIAAAIALMYSYVYLPIRNFGSLDGVDTADASKTAPAPIASSPAVTASPAPAPAHTEAGTAGQAPPAPAAREMEPLVIVITAGDEHAAMRRINKVMHGNSVLRNERFSDTVKEISGTMTARELLTFFNRIESAGKITYSRSRLESCPPAQPLPFVMRLKAAPRTAEKPAPAPAPEPLAESSGLASPGATGSSAPNPAPKPDDKPAEQTAPQAAPVR